MTYKRIDGRIWRLLCGLDEEQNKGLPLGCGRKTRDRALAMSLIERHHPEGFPAVTYWKRTPEGDRVLNEGLRRRRHYPKPRRLRS